jgi:hypothetical protein
VLSSSTAMLTKASLRDRGILKLIAGLLTATEEFHDVTTGGLPEQVGSSAENLKLASLELAAFEEVARWDDGDIERTVQFWLWILVRDPDPDTRDDEADRLQAVAANAIVGQSVGGATFIGKTKLGRGVYEPARGVERRLKVMGQFAYEVPAWDGRSSTF